MDALDELGLLMRPDEEVMASKEEDKRLEQTEISVGNDGAIQQSTTQNPLIEGHQERHTRHHPWFEESLEGSQLGRLRRRRGGDTSRNGSSKVEWEIEEYEGNDDGDLVGVSGSVKRKIESVVGPDHIAMRGAR